jgi:hypothetical protein
MERRVGGMVRPKSSSLPLYSMGVTTSAMNTRDIRPRIL